MISLETHQGGDPHRSFIREREYRSDFIVEWHAKSDNTSSLGAGIGPLLRAAETRIRSEKSLLVAETIDVTNKSFVWCASGKSSLSPHWRLGIEFLLERWNGVPIALILLHLK